jgi:hypothetical protein
MHRSSGESIEEIELRARAQRLEAVEEFGASEFGWRNLALVGWPLLAGIALLDVVVFALLGQSYPGWYLANGALLSLAVPILSGVGIDLDRRYGLISAHPMYFVGAWLVIANDWPSIWEPTGAASRYLAGTRSVRLDRALSWVLGKLLGFGLVAWFFVAGPPQYALNLVCGAPARSALSSGRVVWDSQELVYRKAADGTVLENNWKQSIDVVDATAPKPHDAARRLGFDVKPVSVTYALVAVVLFGIKALIK